MPKKGYKQTEEHIRKNSISHLGNTTGFQKGHKCGLNCRFKKGRIVPKEICKKISEANKGKKPWNTGKKFSLNYRKKLSIAHIGIQAGEKHPGWKKDRNSLQRYNDDAKDRRSSLYREWRKQVYERDNFQCRINNCDCSGRIIAHHILSYKKYPELRYSINNGITLCQFHHPLKRVEEQKLIPMFQTLVEVVRT